MTAEITRAFRSSPTVQWILDTAYKRLIATGHDVFADYLLAVTSEVASAKVFQRRLYYEQRTWDKKFLVARQGMQAALDAMEAWSDKLTQLLRPRTTQITEDNVRAALEELTRLVHNLAQKLLYVTQYLGQDARYSQALAEIYLQQPTQHRPRIFRRYMRNLTRLRELSAHATTLSEGLVTALTVGGSGDVALGSANCEFSIQRKIVTDLVDPSVESWGILWRRLAGDIHSLRLAGPNVVTLRAAVDDVISILVTKEGESPSTPTDRSHRVGLSVARARARHPARRLRAAAMRQLRELDPHHRPRSLGPGSRPEQSTPGRISAKARNPLPGDELASSLDGIALATVRRWVRMLQVHPGLAADPGLSRMARRLGGSERRRRADLMAEARSLVENERSERMDREAFRRNMPQTPSPTDNTTLNHHHDDLGHHQTQGGDASTVVELWSVLQDPKLVEVREAIKRLAGTNGEDARFLEERWTE